MIDPLNLYAAARVGKQAELESEAFTRAVEIARQNILVELERTEAHDFEKVKGLHARLILLMEVANGINKIIADGHHASADINSPGQ